MPAFLYFFAKWDPFIGLDEYGDPQRLGAWPIVIGYWVLIYLVHTYNSERKHYRYALEKILLLDHALTSAEKTEINREVLGIPKWDIDEHGNAIRPTTRTHGV